MTALDLAVITATGLAVITGTIPVPASAVTQQSTAIDRARTEITRLEAELGPQGTPQRRGPPPRALRVPRPHRPRPPAARRLVTPPICPLERPLMSTRGFLSFVSDGQVKTGYNHFDSYPSGLGMDVLTWLRVADHAAEAGRARALRVVDDSTQPTDEDCDRLARYYKPGVGEKSQRPTWYQLLRDTQGSPGAILDAGVILDGSGFPADSLFAEWGYVIDFDAMAFEVYEGFQRSRHSEGRFADMEPLRDSEYFPVRLAKSWPLSDLPDNDAFMVVDGSDED